MIIHRAFIKEVLQTCSVVTAVLFSILFVIRLVDFLGHAAGGNIPIDGIFLLLMLKMILYLDILIPLVLYISTLLTIGRWIRDNELTVINACGIGMGQFIKPAMVLFVIVGSIVAIFSLYLSPLSAEVERSIQHEYRNRTDITSIIPGVFTKTRSGNGVYFVEGYDEKTNTFRDIFFYKINNNEEGVVIADSGHKTLDIKTNEDYLILKNGTQYRSSASTKQFSVIYFDTYTMRLKHPKDSYYVLPVKARSTATLLEDNHQISIGEFHWRIAKVVMLPILLIYALSFSSITYRRNRFPGMLAALLVYFTYSNILGLFVALIRRGDLNPHFALWIVHFLSLSGGIYMLRRRCVDKPLLPRFLI